MLLGYARVSTDEQDTRLQRDALTRAGCERIYEEKASGAKENRPELTKLLDHARTGDVVIVWKLDRLARSLTQLITTATLLAERGVELRSMTEQIDTTSPSGKLTFHLFAALAEFERDLIRQRVNAGLTAARGRGTARRQKTKTETERYRKSEGAAGIRQVQHGEGRRRIPGQLYDALAGGRKGGSLLNTAGNMYGSA
jgi:DNA invertase Pin-like site-specific DNA recombinase